MKHIDAHIHFLGNEPASLAMMAQFDLKMLNICVAEDAHGVWRHQADNYEHLAKTYPDRYAWCTSFDLPRFEDPKYIDTVIRGLERDFDEGAAVACKVWKNIGMEVKTPSGNYILVDDPLLEPIFSYLEQRNKTLLMHIAEPLECWLPLKEGSPHYGYYSQYPEWHMYGKTEMPSHEALMKSRDAIAERHPNLRVIGAHFGSLEYDVAEIAWRFDRYPNFAVDISARLLDFALQDTAKVRQFCMDYQDRILFGTDIVTMEPLSALSAEARESRLKRTAENYQQHFQFFESDTPMTLRGHEVRGLGLPTSIIEKIYCKNAQRWYPGI